mgnify:CR=1 FL=1
MCNTVVVCFLLLPVESVSVIEVIIHKRVESKLVDSVTIPGNCLCIKD